jgi:hypothetical protein
MEVLSMKHVSRIYPKLSFDTIGLSAVVIVSLGIGIFIGKGISLPSARAASTSFVFTGSLDVPGINQKIDRIEDKDTGAVCYYFPKGLVFSCVSKK